MPRQMRSKSESGIYHVMIRGISQMQLFYDEEDRARFIGTLSRYKEECGFALLAWCLMGNHVHLLVKESEVKLPVFMKKIELSYSHYFNTRYGRRGYLFQDRYKSKPVDSDEYLLSVVRYIHRNPLEIGKPITSWTSYEEYLGSPYITDISVVLSILGENVVQARHVFTSLVDAPNAAEPFFLGEESSQRISDSAAIELILELSGLLACTDVCQVGRDERNRVISELRSQGLSVRQISRLTGIGRGIVAAAKPRT